MKTIFKLIILAAVLILAAATQAQADLSEGLVGYWKFDEGTGSIAADSSRNDNSASFANGASWASGKFGQGVLFAGSSDLLNAGSGASLDNLPALTYSAWVYMVSNSGSKIIVDKGGRKN